MEAGSVGCRALAVSTLPPAVGKEGKETMDLQAISPVYSLLFAARYNVAGKKVGGWCAVQLSAAWALWGGERSAAEFQYCVRRW